MAWKTNKCFCCLLFLDLFPAKVESIVMNLICYIIWYRGCSGKIFHDFDSFFVTLLLTPKWPVFLAAQGKYIWGVPPREPHLAWRVVTFISDFRHLSRAYFWCYWANGQFLWAAYSRKLWHQHIKISAQLHVIEAQERHEKSPKKMTSTHPRCSSNVIFTLSHLKKNRLKKPLFGCLYL